MTNTAVHFASILTTDSNPTADDIDHGNKISNTVVAADLDTFSFYDSVGKYNDCKFFLSIKGVSAILIRKCVSFRGNVMIVYKNVLSDTFYCDIVKGH